MKQGFTLEEAERIATELKLDWNSVPFTAEQLRKGLDVELEHGKVNQETNVTNDDPILTGKIALAHLNERADYYELLELVESGAITEVLSKLSQPEDLTDAVESYTRTVSLANQKSNPQKEQIMSERPKIIKVAGHLYQLEETTQAEAAPDYIRVKGMLFQRDDVLTAAKKGGKKKKDEKEDKKKGKGKAKKTPKKKDDKKDAGMSWKDLPKGWTKKSATSFWKDVGGSVPECKRKLKDADEIDSAHKFCTGLKDLMNDMPDKKDKPKAKPKKKKASTAPNFVTFKGVRYQLED